MLFTFSLATSRLVTAAAVSQMRESRTPAALPPLTPELREVIVGCARHIERRSANGSTRLRFKQGAINSGYLLHLYSLFKPYCGYPPKAAYTHPSVIIYFLQHP
jgi:hypothetical protein